MIPASPGDRVPASLAAGQGLVLLRKPRDVTSFQALAPLKKKLGSGRVGHAGTLDRFASGLLVVLVGSYSRLASYVQAGEKRYRGLIVFGKETATLDPEGEVVAEGPLPSREALESAMAAFRGRILQRPPAYSAVHVGGKRAYQLALRGEEPELKERPVEIRELKLLSYDDGAARIELRCSSGTYVRSLARDLAASCGSRAYLGELERLSIGPYSVEEAVAPELFSPERDIVGFSREAASALGLRTLGLEGAALVRSFANGGRIESPAFSVLDGRAAPVAGETAAVFDPEGRILGIIECAQASPRYKLVIPQVEEVRP